MLDVELAADVGQREAARARCREGQAHAERLERERRFGLDERERHAVACKRVQRAQRFESGDAAAGDDDAVGVGADGGHGTTVWAPERPHIACIYAA